MLKPPAQPQRGLYSRLSRPMQRITNTLFVVGVAAVIMTPILTQTHDPARHNSCISNEKQIGIGLLMYAQDYDEQFPCGVRTNRRGSEIVKDTPQEKKIHAGQGWAGGLWPYMKNAQAFACPQRAGLDTDPPGAISEPVGCVDDREIRMYPVSYAYNRNLALHTAGSAMPAPNKTVLLSEIEGGQANARDASERNPRNVYSPAGNGISLLTATDGAAGIQASAGVRYVTGVPGGYERVDFYLFRRTGTTNILLPRHEGGANYVMADGHMKWLEPQNVSAGDNAPEERAAPNYARCQAMGTGSLGPFTVTYSTK